MIRILFYNLLFFALTLMHHAGPADHRASGVTREDCVSCHADLVKYADAHPVVSDACDNCHLTTGNPHPGDGGKEFTLMEGMPDLCFYCHETEPREEHEHKPVASMECLSCHAVHGSPEPGLLRYPEQELCLSCHPAIRQLVRGNSRLHTAIGEGGCSQCHRAHGSGLRGLLISDYPSGDYAVADPDTFGLCFLCHDPALLDSDGAEGITGFRTGEENLHHLHIQGNKGRNCRLCHNLHGSQYEYLIAEKIRFGQWEMRMNFKSVEDGGSCLPGCHGLKTYQR